METKNDQIFSLKTGILIYDQSSTTDFNMVPSEHTFVFLI